MTLPIIVNKFDPFALAASIGRVLGAPVNTGSVTYDIPFPENSRWVWVGTTGNLSYVKYDGSTETLPNMAAGVWHPIAAIRVNSSGTTIAANQLRWGS